jgi:formiminotetrahydrofolate cyclodeaminase
MIWIADVRRWRMAASGITATPTPPEIKARVAQLLALSKYPTNGINDASVADQARAAFIMAATAADAIKNDHVRFKDDGEDPTNKKRVFGRIQ